MLNTSVASFKGKHLSYSKHLFNASLVCWEYVLHVQSWVADWVRSVFEWDLYLRRDKWCYNDSLHIYNIKTHGLGFPTCPEHYRCITIFDQIVIWTAIDFHSRIIII